MTCIRRAIISMLGAVAVGVIGSPSARADEISPTAFIIDETTNPGQTTISVGSDFDDLTSCLPAVNNPHILPGTTAVCNLGFLTVPFTTKQTLLVEFKEPGGSLISDTLTAETHGSSADSNSGATVLTITFVSDSSKPAPGLKGTKESPDEVAGPVTFDISSFGLMNSSGVPLTTITVINDADDQAPDTPEPASYILAVTGCLALFITGWRRRRAGVDAPIAFM